MIYTKFNTEEIKEKLKNCLTYERYIHSLGVMEMAVELAKRFNCNIEKAEIAGLLTYGLVTPGPILMVSVSDAINAKVSYTFLLL